MILGFFVSNDLGDIIIHKAFNNTSDNSEWSPQNFTSCCKRNLADNLLLPTCFKFENIYYVNLTENDLVFTTVSNENYSSVLYIHKKIQNAVKLCSDILGQVSEKTVLSNIGIVYDILLETIEGSCDTNAINFDQTWKKNVGDSSFLSLIPSNLFGIQPVTNTFVKSAESSKVPISRNNQSITKVKNADNIYVDLIEEIKVILDKNGAPILREVTGKMSIKSYLSQSVDMVISLPENVTICKESKKAENSFITLNHCHFSSLVKCNEFPKNIEVTAKPGQNSVLDYSINTQAFNLPFTLYDSITKLSENSLQFELKFYCNLPPGFSPINFTSSFPLPCNTVSVSGQSSFKGIEFLHDKKHSKLKWSCDILPAQSHHSVEIKLIVNEITPLTLLEVSYIDISFEVPLTCLSNLKISNVKIKNLNPSTKAMVKKWARCITHSKSYQFLLKSSLT